MGGGPGVVVLKIPQQPDRSLRPANNKRFHYAGELSDDLFERAARVVNPPMKSALQYGDGVRAGVCGDPNSFQDSGPSGSMSHRIDDVVYSEAIGLSGHFGGIIGSVGMLPGIAHIHIEIDADHEATVIVIDAAPMGLSLHLHNNPASPSHAQVPQARDL